MIARVRRLQDLPDAVAAVEREVGRPVGFDSLDEPNTAINAALEQLTSLKVSDYC